jgi:hypothetical protein
MAKHSKTNEENLDSEYAPQEAQDRFQRLVKTALDTPPKPQKSMTQKRNWAQRTKKAKKR